MDVTSDDVWSVMDFPMPRLEALAGAHHVDIEEHRAASALIEAMAFLALTIDGQILRPAKRPRLLLAGHAAASRSPADRGGTARLGRSSGSPRSRGDWNQLCAIVGPWSESDGYDRSRWHELSFRDAAQEAEYERRVAEHGLRRRDEE